MPDHSGEVITVRGCTCASLKVMRSPARGPARSASGTPVVRSSAWKPWTASRPVQVPDSVRIASQACSTRSSDGRPSLERVEHACEAILTLSGTCNGRLAVQGFQALERTTGVPLADLAGPRAGDRITFKDAQVQPRTVITSPEWSGIEAHGRRYSPFTTNVERDKPWHTLSGRQHFYLDHAWMLELSE